MSMIAFGICALFLISTISAIPAPSGIVRSAIIQNKQYVPVRCTITWSKLPSGTEINPDVITIDSMQSKIVNEKMVDMGTWTAASNIKTITCGNSVLSSPFEGVGIAKLWKFSVESNRIVSVGPSSTDP